MPGSSADRGGSLDVTASTRRRLQPTRGVLVAPNYLLTCQFDRMGPTAVLQDVDGGDEYSIKAFNRAAFLYAVLERTSPQDDGWVACDQVARAVWGRKASANNVNTLVYRIRRELKSAGFSADFLEVKRGHVRLVAPEAPPTDQPNEVEVFNDALAALRDATGEDERRQARERLLLAVDRIALVPDLYVDAK